MLLQAGWAVDIWIQFMPSFTTKIIFSKENEELQEDEDLRRENKMLQEENEKL